MRTVSVFVHEISVNLFYHNYNLYNTKMYLPICFDFESYTIFWLTQIWYFFIFPNTIHTLRLFILTYLIGTFRYIIHSFRDLSSLPQSPVKGPFPNEKYSKIMQNFPKSSFLPLYFYSQMTNWFNMHSLLLHLLKITRVLHLCIIIFCYRKKKLP